MSKITEKPRQVRGKLTPAKLKMPMSHIDFSQPMTYEEIWEATEAVMKHFGWTSGERWHLVFEYIDFHANDSKFTDPKFSAWLESL